MERREDGTQTRAGGRRVKVREPRRLDIDYCVTVGRLLHLSEVCSSLISNGKGKKTQLTDL